MIVNRRINSVEQKAGLFHKRQTLTCSNAAEDYGGAVFSPRHQVHTELFRAPVPGGNPHNSQIRIELEFKRVKAIRQAFSYRFQRGFLESPQFKKSLHFCLAIRPLRSVPTAAIRFRTEVTHKPW